MKVYLPTFAFKAEDFVCKTRAELSPKKLASRANAKIGPLIAALEIFASRDHETHCDWIDNAVGTCDCAYGKARKALGRD